MPKVRDDPKLLEAIELVANGVSARAAWERCGQPNGEKGIQNIRKAGKKRAEEQLAQADQQAGVEPEPEPTPESGSGPGKGNAAAGYRLRPAQLKQVLVAKAEARAEYNKIYMEATQHWQNLFVSGATGKGKHSADSVAASFSDRLPQGFKLTGRMLKNALLQGRSGKEPNKPGPKAAIPDSFVLAISSYAQLRQVAGDEQTPRMLRRVATAAAAGTDIESRLSTDSQRARLLERVRNTQSLSTSGTCAIDDRRWNWLTSSNLTQWFEGYKKCLLDAGFIDAIPEDIFEPIVIDPKKAARMINGDETHQKLSNEGESRGPRATVYVNKELGRSGKRKVVYQKHATFLAWVTYDGQVGAPHLMLATDAAAAKKGTDATQEQIDSIRMRPEWTFGVPRVIGQFGCAEPQTWEPTFIMTEKGGMESGGLEQFARTNLLPKYPNLSPTWDIDDDGNILKGPLFFQLDAGPDRLTECSLPFRTEMWKQGVILFPGLPNGTSANQVCDDLFGPYKTGCTQNADDIVAERIQASEKERSSGGTSSPALKLDFCDLGRIMNGKEGDPIELKPFERAFTPERIVASVKKLGLNPIDLRVALAHKRVRDDSATGTRTDKIAEVREQHTQSLNALAQRGFDTSGLQVAAPPAARFVAPPSDQEAQWKALKEMGSSVGAMWHAVGAKAFNAPEVTGPALQRLQERDAESKAKTARQLSDYNSVWTHATKVYEHLETEQLYFSDLSAADAKVLVSFAHRAQKQLGVGEHNKNRTTAVAYLEGLGMEAMGKLVRQRPPENQDVAVATPLNEPAPGEPLLALPAPVSDLLSFGKHGCQLPNEELSPRAAPPWLEAALEPDSSTAKELLGRYILYKWPPRLGGWAVGKVTSVQKEASVQVKSVKCNFSVFYECDQQSADHVLSLSAYAKTAKSPSDSWVLLG